MTCAEIRDLLELYAIGVLDPDEHMEVSRHLATDCRECTTNLRRAIGFNSALLLTVPEASASPALRNRVIGSVRPAMAPRPWAWMGLAGALAAGLAFVTVENRHKSDQIAEDNHQISAIRQERNQAGREIQRLNNAFSFLRDPQTRPANASAQANQPRGNYFISPKGVMLIASGLPQLEPGKTYEMWIIPKGGAPKPAGLFKPDESGSAIHFLTEPVDVATASALAITEEPENGSPAPTTTPFLVTPVAGL